MLLIFIGGQSASGKTGLSQHLLRKIQAWNVSAQMLNMDDYFRERPEGIDPEQYRLITNFDTPEIMDFNLLKEHLLTLKDKKPILKYKFEFKSNRREGAEHIQPSDVIIIEGIFAQYFYKNFMSDELEALSINVATDDYLDIVKRRIKRDIQHRNRKEEVVKQQDKQFVGPGFFKYTAHSAAGSDIFILNKYHADEEEQAKILDAAADSIIDEINQVKDNPIEPKRPAPNVQAMVAQSHLMAGTLTEPTQFSGYFNGVFNKHQGDFSKMFTDAEQIKRSSVIADLRKYVDRIRVHVDTNTRQLDFKHNFWFFKNSRAANREANFYLAQQLIDNLLSHPEQSILEVFNDVEGQRKQIIKNKNINQKLDFTDRGINSSELKAILRKAAEAPSIKPAY